MVDSDLSIRRAVPADLDDIIEVGTAALGWQVGEPNAELFRWKHEANPFGVSPIWLAEAEGRIAGYRAFMRWELADETGGVWRCVRAVDTATHPDFQRRGIFSKLTLHALDEMQSEGIKIVFNTPNAQSRPGYLKMGWIDVGRLPVAFRPTSFKSAVRLAQARTAADKWSVSSATGRAAGEVFDDPALADLIAGQPRPAALATQLSVDLLEWRYRFEPLGFRMWAPDGVADGVVLFRVRARGQARECSVGHVLSPNGDVARRRSLLRGLARVVDADYLLLLEREALRHGLLPLPRQGPRLTARHVTRRPPPTTELWSLPLGDIEPF